MKINTINSIAGILSIAALGTLSLSAQDADMEKMHQKGKKKGAMKGEMKGMHQGMTKAIALISPVGGSNIKGTVVFEKEGNGVKVTASVGGFVPNTKHGIHVHEFGDLGAPDATSAGGHFNPGGHDHAMPDTEMRHAGDLGNLTADENGQATLTLTVKNLKLGPGPQGILGRAVIIHAREDDGGQPTGNAGDRIGAGVIGISKDGMPASPEAKMEEEKVDKEMEEKTVAPEEMKKAGMEDEKAEMPATEVGEPMPAPDLEKEPVEADPKAAEDVKTSDAAE